MDTSVRQEAEDKIKRVIDDMSQTERLIAYSYLHNGYNVRIAYIDHAIDNAVKEGK